MNGPGFGWGRFHMLKRMMHPRHGWHHAYTPQEEARMRANGWIEDAPVAAPQVNESLLSPPVLAPAPVGAAPKRKPGRPKRSDA